MSGGFLEYIGPLRTVVTPHKKLNDLNPVTAQTTTNAIETSDNETLCFWLVVGTIKM